MACLVFGIPLYTFSEEVCRWTDSGNRGTPVTGYESTGCPITHIGEAAAGGRTPLVTFMAPRGGGYNTAKQQLNCQSLWVFTIGGHAVGLASSRLVKSMRKGGVQGHLRMVQVQLGLD